MVRSDTQHMDCPDIMKPQDSALQVRGLTKRFDRLAVDALDLTVRSGDVYALVGPHGAGKTTHLRIVAGRLLPQAYGPHDAGVQRLGSVELRPVVLVEGLLLHQVQGPHGAKYGWHGANRS